MSTQRLLSQHLANLEHLTSTRDRLLVVRLHTGDEHERASLDRQIWAKNQEICRTREAVSDLEK